MISSIQEKSFRPQDHISAPKQLPGTASIFLKTKIKQNPSFTFKMGSDPPLIHARNFSKLTIKEEKRYEQILTVKWGQKH